VGGSFVSSDDSDTSFILPPGTASNFSDGLVNTGYLNLALTANNATIESAIFLECDGCWFLFNFLIKFFCRYGMVETIVVVTAADGELKSIPISNAQGTTVSIAMQVWGVFFSPLEYLPYLTLFCQIPQYVIGGVAEVLFAVTGFEFVFREAPDTLRAVLMSLFLVTDAVGNIIIIVIAQVHIGTASTKFFFYAGQMAVVVFVFVFLASRYTYRATREAIAQGKKEPKVSHAACACTSASGTASSDV
jgi:hypothetical protein